MDSVLNQAPIQCNECGGLHEPSGSRSDCIIYWKRRSFENKDTEKSIPYTIDARVWAKEWLLTIKSHPAIPHDEWTMIGWFANAIMAGYDEAQRRFDPKPRRCVATVKPTWWRRDPAQCAHAAKHGSPFCAKHQA